MDQTKDGCGVESTQQGVDLDGDRWIELLVYEVTVTR